MPQLLAKTNLRRVPSNYHSIEFNCLLEETTIDDNKVLCVMTHENIWYDEIFQQRADVDNFNFFLTKKEANDALKQINKILKGKSIGRYLS